MPRTVQGRRRLEASDERRHFAAKVVEKDAGECLSLNVESCRVSA